MGIGEDAHNSDYVANLKRGLADAGMETKSLIQLIFPWGSFTSALNAATRFAADKKFNKIIFQVII